ncbi:hypothetical protein HMPREF1146_0508 [Prevotella sp. MSX73]|nr:hypothetical protein HMPREF1146_0508 [Prevotella sp. MSX73]
MVQGLRTKVKVAFVTLEVKKLGKPKWLYYTTKRKKYGWQIV